MIRCYGHKQSFQQIIIAHIPFILVNCHLFALIAWVERVVLLLRAIRSFAKSRSAKAVYENIWEHRMAVVEAVADAA